MPGFKLRPSFPAEVITNDTSGETIVFVFCFKHQFTFSELNLLEARTHLEKVFRVNFSERFIPSFQFELEWKEVFRFFVDILSKQLTRNILLRLRKFITPSLVRSYNGAREGNLNPKVARNVEKERALHDASDEQGFGSQKAAYISCSTIGTMLIHLPSSNELT